MTEEIENEKIISLFDEDIQADQTLAQVLDAFDEMLVLEKNLKKDFEKAKESRMLLEEELYERMADFRSIKVRDKTFFKKRDRYCSINVANREEAHEWLKECGREYIIEKSVNAKTLTAEIKGMKLKRNEIPECITVVEKNRVGVRKA